MGNRIHTFKRPVSSAAPISWTASEKALSALDFGEARQLGYLYLFLVFYEFSSCYMLEYFLSVRFGYARILFDPQRAEIYFWVCVLTPLAVLPAGTRLQNASQFMFPVLTSLIMLTTPLFLIGQVSLTQFWPIYGCIMVSMLVLAFASRLQIAGLARPVAERSYRLWIAGLCAFFGVLLGIGATQNFQFVSFLDIYKVRESADYASNFIVRVVIMYVFSLGGLLVGIGLLRRSRILAIVGLFGFVFCYAVSQFKSALLAPVWLVYVYLCVRFFCKGWAIRFYAALTAPFFVGFFILWLFPESADGFEGNFWGFSYLAFINYRFYGTSNIAVGLYQEYFSSHAVTLWSHITGVNWFVHYPYGEQQIAKLLNDYFDDGNFNAGFLATDSIAAYGFEAIPLVTLGLAAIYVVANSVARGINQNVLAMLMIMPALMFNERAMSTSVLTGGIIFFLFYLALMPTSWRRGI